MAKEIIMPKNGMDMKEGVLLRWLVKVGDKVEKDDPVMEIETDKVTMESEAPAGGTVLALYYEEGATIPVLKTMGYIGEEGENVPDAPPDAEPAIDAVPEIEMTPIEPEQEYEKEHEKEHNGDGSRYVQEETEQESAGTEHNGDGSFMFRMRQDMKRTVPLML